jgi:hypothetical protein
VSGIAAPSPSSASDDGRDGARRTNRCDADAAPSVASGASPGGGRNCPSVFGSFALVLPCLGYVRLAGSLQFAVAGVDMGVILASKLELCFMRYEFTDYEWAAVRFGVPLPK